MYTVRGKTPPANGKPPMVIHGRLFYSREELVDVLVVCQQMFLALKMDEEDINKLAGSKLERALK